MNKPEVMHLLQLLMGKAHEGKADDRASSSRTSPYKTPSSSEGKGKSKGKNKSSPKMPNVLVNGGCRATSNAGDPFAWVQFGNLHQQSHVLKVRQRTPCLCFAEWKTSSVHQLSQ